MLNRRGFNMLELLVTIAVIAILMVIVILLLNPVELQKNARDGNRLGDLKLINDTLDFYKADVRPSSTSAWGNPMTVYISLPDANANCSGLNLPPLSTGWSYHCATPTTYRNVDGTGWMPVNLKDFSFGAPFATLPVDPLNKSDCLGLQGGMYYTYVVGGNGKYVVTVPLESSKYLKKNGVARNDDGADVTRLEITNNASTTLWASALGLSGYWKLEEGQGSFASDISPYFNNLSINNVPFYAQWAAGKIGNGLGFNFDTSQSASAFKTTPTGFDFGTGSFSFGTWVNFDAAGDSPLDLQVPMWAQIANLGSGSVTSRGFDFEFDEAAGRLDAKISDGTLRNTASYNYNFRDGNWHHIFTVVDRIANTLALYVDGVQKNQAGVTVGSVNVTPGSAFSLSFAVPHYGLQGKVDETLVYRRALASCEVKALYEAAN